MMPLNPLRMLSVISHMLSVISIALLGITGCSSDVKDSIIEASQLHRQASLKLDSMEDNLSASSKSAHPVSTEIAPSPGRLNPFEMASTFENESDSLDRGNAKREIRVLGFVEVDKPMVILSIDGRSQSFCVNDTHDRITVTEVSPPRARITLDGVTWYASIFDPR
jgi:hypothetical protein